ncbi:hypothetical protein BpHYR1_027794 [Brachionus plicatilis]|uniref:Uncharacterized protein n=1 Tax=Brachionus plicatilis TaxID=10195 RepID=A0A3M7RUH3_BRAPC|nr:hypothetical protein BpHYR1_027794 [Brachionus plicatilis]
MNSRKIRIKFLIQNSKSNFHCFSSAFPILVNQQVILENKHAGLKIREKNEIELFHLIMIS